MRVMCSAWPGRVARLEAMESRRLLSASVVDGTLQVVGTSAGDAIVVYASPPQAPGQYVVSIRAAANNAPIEEFRFPVAGVTSVSVRALGGDDVVRLDALNEKDQDVRVPSRIDGGIGNDLIVGTIARDVITGGFGSDRVIAKSGDDWVDGGWGRDDLSGGDGNDLVFGNYGDDAVYGNAGDDRLIGGAGNDVVGSPGTASSTPEPGNDLLIGGSGEDWMSGGAGTDRVFGNTGRDHFSPLDEDRVEIRDRAPGEPKDVPTPDGRGYVTFAFRGTVTSVSTSRRSGIDPADLPPVGTEFRGTYTFNPLAVDAFSGADDGGYDTSPNGPVVIQIGDYRWEGPASFVGVHDHPAGDLYEVADGLPSLELVSHPDLAATLNRWNFSLQVEGDPALLNGPGLPRVPPSLDHATRRTLSLTGDSGTNTSPVPYVDIEATLDSLTLVPPEPSAG